MDKIKIVTTYWQYMAEGNGEGLRNLFDPQAKSYLHDSNEILSIDDWVRHIHSSAEGEGDWHTTVDRIEGLENGQVVSTTFHRSASWVGFVNSFFTIEAGKITELHEYYAPCDDNIVPQWRGDLAEDERI